MKKNVKIVLGVMGVIILLAVIMMASAVNQAKESNEQVEKAKAYVTYVESEHPQLTADQQKAYESAKKLVEANEAGEARVKEAQENADRVSAEINNSK